ncbi:MAG: VIT1/CCC1 transporter family protein [Candidatus Hydrogenedentes bacterium]|nr:VIT1/CCC1 transporter family protein [Candidatus Hydrogenedentota bacterium]
MDAKTLSQWRRHYRDEVDAAYLYRTLAAVEPREERKNVYERLARVEDRHVEVWSKLFREKGLNVPKAIPTATARLKATVARQFGGDLLLKQLLREEGQEVKGYLQFHKESGPGAAQDAALKLARESAQHASALRDLDGTGAGESWHKLESGDLLRNIVYGFNDGLTANFGLVAGVMGAEAAPHFIVLSGLAGMIADALSMGSSGYLASKSEQEVHDHEIAMEREEIRLMPDLEREELALIYEAKGMSPDQAKQLAEDMMKTPDRALEEMVREELQIGEQRTTPMKEAWTTGIATAIGAFIPVAPFMVMSNAMHAAWVSFTIAMVSHFAVGAARSLFTGRGVFRSGFDMFLVGLGVAGIGYLFGYLLTGVVG